jgi:transcriptional regulator with XRE-family HTH domain
MRELCQQHGLVRPIDFARAAGISKAYAHLLWTGKRLVGRKMAKKLAPVFNMAPEQLIMLERPTC